MINRHTLCVGVVKSDDSAGPLTDERASLRSVIQRMSRQESAAREREREREHFPEVIYLGMMYMFIVLLHIPESYSRLCSISTLVGF